MLRVAIFNDTCGAHFGCDAVMAAIGALATRYDGEIIYSHPVGKPWQEDSLALEAIRRSDVVIVNGEGSMHHSSRKARSLSQLAVHCAEIAKPCYLLNATLQSNDTEIVEALRTFRRIWVRESASAQELRNSRIEASICPDLSLFHEFEVTGPQVPRPLIIDSVQRRRHPELARVADAHGARLVTMKHNEKGGLAFPLKGLFRQRIAVESGPVEPIPEVRTFHQFAALMGRHQCIITGRFHGFCFGLKMALPMLVLPSNTWKCEAMLTDVRLNRNRLVESNITSLPPPYTSEEFENIDSYLASARQQIGRMFQAILVDRE